jgi:type II secretory pathway pseudopilin PulG
VAIIGLLSSVVLASLNSARGKAKNAAVKQEVRELAKLFELEYNDNGSYTNLNTNSCSWVTISSSNCNSFFTGTYAVQARNICNNIVSNAKTDLWVSPGYGLLICNPIDGSKKYSIMAALNDNPSSYFFCSGSSGTSDNAQYWISRLDGTDIQSNSARWSESPVGCYYNP